MALFDTYAPNRPTYLRPRTFNGNTWSNLKLSLSGSTKTGSQNLWGKIANVGLPAALSIVGGIYAGPLGSTAGSALGTLANRGLNAGSRNILSGTDAANMDAETTNREERDDALVSSLSNFAGNIAGGIASNIRSNADDNALEGISDQSISDFLYDEAGSEYGNMAQSLLRNTNANATPLLNNLFGGNNNNQSGMNWAALSNSLLQAAQPIPTAPQAGYTMPTQPMQNSSILPNPDANSNITYLQERQRVSDPYASNTESPYRYLNGFAEGGEIPFKYFDGGQTPTIYPSADKTSEDFFMVDKGIVDRHGLSNLFQNISFGQGRYGERIFDQESNLIQKSIMKSNMSEQAKKLAIGEHVFEEIKTHKDFSGGKSETQEDNFAKGGVVTPANVKPQVSAFQAQYNQWARANGQKTIKVDGLFGPETKGAIEKWNTSNPEKYKFDITTSQTSKTGSPINTLGSIQLLSVDTPETATPNAQANVDTNLPEAFANIQTSLANGTAPVVANTPSVASTPTSQGTVLTPAQRDNLFGNIGDLAGAGVGALLGSRGVPRYQPTEEYTRMLNEVYANKDQGLAPEELSAINQGLTNNYAASVNAIRNVSGGGGTQGAVLGALGNASSQLNDAYLQRALQDVVARRNNYSRYQNAVMNDLAIDQNIFAQDQQAALASQQAGLTLLDRSLQNIADRRQFNQQYGEGTAYSNLLASFSQGTDQQNSRATGLVDSYRRLLEQQAKPNSTL